MIFYRNGSSIVSINWKNNYICNKSVFFFNAATAKKDDHPENILVRKGVPLSEIRAMSLAERSALAIG